MRHHAAARGTLGLALGVLLSLPAAAQELTIGVGGAFTSMDPHWQDLSPNHALTYHVWDRLVHPTGPEANVKAFCAALAAASLALAGCSGAQVRADAATRFSIATCSCPDCLKFFA